MIKIFDRSRYIFPLKGVKSSQKHKINQQRYLGFHPWEMVKK
ncbi:hypothetical protein FHW36_101684 [Chitinophaga polysaccharea]|uniref:Uncharacterized protein n=1 Tax=Chitinophaga polysaccharea TaxID=1293035 RepID=A0A561Q319_9BACT|nr:hypothetical protein FHW36_101684 [Chitinophaga polysaccharea]